MKYHWDIFCSVVDNFGDIGVTWRLARQLVAEYNVTVRLFVDDLSAFARLCPEANSSLTQQTEQGVEICLWHKPWQNVMPADVVIEAFACTLPDSYVLAMAEYNNHKPILWLNLEYLSAETWIDDCHGLPSPQNNGLDKYFFFPGFTQKSGGLLRENNLIAERKKFQADAAAQVNFLASLGVNRLPNSRLISLFSYENQALASWLEQLSKSEQTIQLLVPEGRCLADIKSWLNISTFAVGDSIQREQLSIHVLPFMSQENYDRLLWCCDLNAVRGEDSFIRAQWAGRPLLWHIYVQEENAHLEKLNAFLAIYVQQMSSDAKVAINNCFQAWNTNTTMENAWQQLQKTWPEQQSHAENWCLEQASNKNLSESLVEYHLKWLK